MTVVVALVDGEQREYEKVAVSENGWLKCFDPVDHGADLADEEYLEDRYPPQRVRRVRRVRKQTQRRRGARPI